MTAEDDCLSEISQLIDKSKNLKSLLLAVKENAQKFAVSRDLLREVGTTNPGEDVDLLQQNLAKQERVIEKLQHTVSIMTENSQSQLESLTASTEIATTCQLEKAAIVSELSECRLRIDELESSRYNLEKLVNLARNHLDDANKYTESLNCQLKAATEELTRENEAKRIISKELEDEKSMHKQQVTGFEHDAAEYRNDSTLKEATIKQLRRDLDAERLEARIHRTATSAAFRLLDSLRDKETFRNLVDRARMRFSNSASDEANGSSRYILSRSDANDVNRGKRCRDQEDESDAPTKHQRQSRKTNSRELNSLLAQDGEGIKVEVSQKESENSCINVRTTRDRGYEQKRRSKTQNKGDGGKWGDKLKRLPRNSRRQYVAPEWINDDFE